MFLIATNLITPRALFSPTHLPKNQIWIGSDEPFQSYGHSKLYKTADGRDLGFGRSGSSAIRSADLENPKQEPKCMKWIGWPVAEIWPFEIFQNARSVGRWSVGHRPYTLASCTPLRYVRNVAREEWKRENTLMNAVVSHKSGEGTLRIVFNFVYTDAVHVPCLSLAHDGRGASVYGWRRLTGTCKRHH